MEDLASSVIDVISEFIPDLPFFLKTVVDTRDELTHPGLGRVYVENVDTYALWKQLKAMFEICVLRSLGIPAPLLIRIGQEFQRQGQTMISRN